jgi:hypothetical protein
MPNITLRWEQPDLHHWVAYAEMTLTTTKLGGRMREKRVASIRRALRGDALTDPTGAFIITTNDFDNVLEVPTLDVAKAHVEGLFALRYADGEWH